MKNIYNLDLLEETFGYREQYGSRVLSVRRVPGGWIFTELHDSQGDGNNVQQRLSSVFVPYSDEFKEKNAPAMSDPSLM
jgi:hypothetical protein